jgi:SSS family solute:Na+ symporter
MIRYMTAKSVKSLRETAVLYPIAVMLVWVPAIIISFWGAAQLPNLGQADFVLPTMVGEYLPFWVIGFALAGILAALMSSIDGQVLTLSTFFTEDFIREFRSDPEGREVLYTRIFVVALYALSYIGALISREAIIDTATFFLSGYALMFFPIVAAFFWRRSTKETAYVGLIFGFVALWAFDLGLVPPTLTFGFLPVIPVLVAQIVLMVVTTYATSPPEDGRIEEYEGLFEGIW